MTHRNVIGAAVVVAAVVVLAVVAVIVVAIADFRNPPEGADRLGCPAGGRQGRLKLAA